MPIMGIPLEFLGPSTASFTSQCVALADPVCLCRHLPVAPLDLHSLQLLQGQSPSPCLPGLGYFGSSEPRCAPRVGIVASCAREPNWTSWENREGISALPFSGVALDLFPLIPTQNISPGIFCSAGTAERAGRFLGMHFLGERCSLSS